MNAGHCGASVRQAACILATKERMRYQKLLHVSKMKTVIGNLWQHILRVDCSLSTYFFYHCTMCHTALCCAMCHAVIEHKYSLNCTSMTSAQFHTLRVIVDESHLRYGATKQHHSKHKQYGART